MEKKKKALYRFYCLDCDNAWHEILTEENTVSECDYCGNPQKPEDLTE